jgi:hypothetical protein
MPPVQDSATAIVFPCLSSLLCILVNVLSGIITIITVFNYIDKPGFSAKIITINLWGKVKILTGGRAEAPTKLSNKFG